MCKNIIEAMFTCRGRPYRPSFARPSCHFVVARWREHRQQVPLVNEIDGLGPRRTSRLAHVHLDILWMRERIVVRGRDVRHPGRRVTCCPTAEDGARTGKGGE